MEKAEKKKPVQIINDMIVQELFTARLNDEKLVWRKPWFVFPKQNAVSGYEYNAINRLLLGNDEEEFYVTMKQVNDAGETIKSFNWFYVYNTFRKTREVPADYVAKFWESIEVIQGTKYAVTWQNTYTKLLRLSDTTMKAPKTGKVFTPRQDLEDFIASRIPVTIKIGGGTADYNALDDVVIVPSADRFTSVSEYYKTLFHEVAHAMGSPLRAKTWKVFPDEATMKKNYIREELTAELTAATMMHKFGIEFDIKNTTAYIDQWIEAVQNDEQLFVTASRNAEKIIKYLGV